MEQKYCSDCEKLIPIEAINCPYCNVKQYADFEIEKEKVLKSRSVAVFLSFLLGGFGVHKLYLNEFWWGVAYLFFSFTFVPSILAIYDGIVLLRMKEEDFNKKYN